MAYTYNKVNWQDVPSTATPRNAANLGNMDTGIKENNKMLNGTTPAGNMIVDSIESKNLFNYESIFPATTSVGGTDIEYSTLATITEVGKNYIKFKVADVWKGIACDFIEIEPSTSYTISYQSSKGQNEQFIKVCFYDNNKTFISDNAINGSLLTSTSPASAKYMRIVLENINTTADEITFSEIMVEKGTSATTPTTHQNLENTKGVWIELEPKTGFAHFQYGHLKISKKNNIVTIIGGISITEMTSWLKSIANIPIGYRPISEIDIICRNTSGDLAIIGILDDVRWLSTVSGQQISSGEVLINCSYIV